MICTIYPINGIYSYNLRIHFFILCYSFIDLPLDLQVLLRIVVISEEIPITHLIRRFHYHVSILWFSMPFMHSIYLMFSDYLCFLSGLWIKYIAPGVSYLRNRDPQLVVVTVKQTHRTQTAQKTSISFPVMGTINALSSTRAPLGLSEFVSIVLVHVLSEHR